MRPVLGPEDPYILTDSELAAPGLSWSQSLIDGRHGQVDFEAVRKAARVALDRAILNSVSPSQRNYIRERLGRGELMLTPEGVAIQRYWCYGEILASNMGDEGDKFDRLRARYESRYRAQVNSLKAEFDANGNGVADWSVDLAAAHTGSG